MSSCCPPHQCKMDLASTRHRSCRLGPLAAIFPTFQLPTGTRDGLNFNFMLSVSELSSVTITAAAAVLHPLHEQLARKMTSRLFNNRDAVARDVFSLMFPDICGGMPVD